MQDIHDIRSPVQVGMDFSWVLPVLGALAGILILGLLFVLVRKWMKNRKVDPSVKLLPEPLSPYEAALAELAALSASTATDLRLFYFDLTLLVRKYISASFKVHALEMTSQQFAACVRGLEMPEPFKKQMVEFYHSCDPYKYAGVVPGALQIKSDLDAVKNMIIWMEEQLQSRDRQDENGQEVQK